MSLVPDALLDQYALVEGDLEVCAEPSEVRLQHRKCRRSLCSTNSDFVLRSISSEMLGDPFWASGPSFRKHPPKDLKGTFRARPHATPQQFHELQF